MRFRQILQAGLAVAKKQNKSAYFFSLSEDSTKLVHINYLAKSELVDGFNAKSWIGKVSDLVGGRGGGRDDSAQGVGEKVDSIEEAMGVAREAFEKRS